MSDTREIFKGSNHYSDLLDSFTNEDEPKIQFNDKTKEISEAIFFHICKMKYAGWRHKINFKRNPLLFAPRIDD